MNSAERGLLVAAEARQWDRTPFRWQQSVKGPGGGCDCRGLVSGVARELGFPEATSIYATMADYSAKRPVPTALLTQGLGLVFDRLTVRRGSDVPDGLQAGDVLQLCMKGKPQHLVIVTEPGPDGFAVHARIGPKNWVRETKLATLLRAYPLFAAYRWKPQ